MQRETRIFPGLGPVPGRAHPNGDAANACPQTGQGHLKPHTWKGPNTATQPWGGTGNAAMYLRVPTLVSPTCHTTVNADWVALGKCK